MLISQTKIPHRIFSDIYHQVELSHEESCNGQKRVLVTQVNNLKFPFDAAYNLFCEKCESSIFINGEELDENLSYKLS